MRFNLLKVFFTLSIPFNIFLICFFYSFYHFQFAILIGLFGGFFAGGLMAIILSIQGYTTDINISQEVGLDVPYEEAFKKCIDAISSLGVKINLEDKKSGLLKARGPITWSSWGQVIEISLKRTDEGKTWVKVLSRPWLPFQISDRGENQNNVKQVVEFIKK